jgi:hypothetical protein
MNVDCPSIGNPEVELTQCLEELKVMLVSTGVVSPASPLELRQTSSDGHRPTLVVAGESKRGKSAFVNALLRIPQLAPSGPNEITNVYTIFSFDTASDVNVVFQDDFMPITVPLPQLRDWVTERHNPQNDKRVAYVHAKVNAPLLEEFAVIDTPGTGSPSAAHGAMTIAALEHADCLVMITDAATPVTRAELEFLAHAAAKIESISLVLSKIDRFPAWETIYRQNLELLQDPERGLDRVSLLTVSSAIALADPVDASLREESGLAAVEDHLREQMSFDRSRLTSLNRVRQAVSLIQMVDYQLRLSSFGVSSDTSDMDALQRAEQRLRDVTDNATLWMGAIDRKLAELSQHQSDRIQDELREVEALELEELASAVHHEPEALITEVLRRISRVAVDIRIDTLSSLEALVVDVLVEVDRGEIRQLLDAGSTTAPRLDWQVAPPALRSANSYDRMMTLSSFSSGRFIGASAVPLAASMGIGLGPLGLVLGLGVGAFAAGIASQGRRRLVRDGDMRNWLSKQIAVATNRLISENQRLISTLGPTLRDAILAQVRSERLEIQRTIEDQKGAHTKSGEERARQQAQITHDRRSLSVLYGRLISVKNSLLEEVEHA